MKLKEEWKREFRSEIHGLADRLVQITSKKESPTKLIVEFGKWFKIPEVKDYVTQEADNKQLAFSVAPDEESQYEIEAYLADLAAFVDIMVLIQEIPDALDESIFDPQEKKMAYLGCFKMVTEFELAKQEFYRRWADIE